MSHLILMRHGNTFETGETPRRVGAATDLPLTTAGEAQAQALAALIKAHFLPLSAIITAPLLRTKRVAEVIASATNVVLTVDERLAEITYGAWENKTDAAIAARGNAAQLAAWDNDGVWPEGAGWTPPKATLEHNIAALLDEQHKNLLMPESGHRILVTSNGILRFVYQALTGKPPVPETKVKTGHYGVLSPTENGWTIEAWNKAP